MGPFTAMGSVSGTEMKDKVIKSSRRLSNEDLALEVETDMLY
jgi:hypothetical protein